MSYPTLAPFIQQRPWLMRWMRPLARWYFDNSGYRKLGLRADDLIPEESESVQLALKRLPPKEAYDRVFRMRRAFQDISYLEPIIKEIEAERTEREDLESMIIKKRTSASTKGGH
ncbi:Cytochrome b-c1 complex subunit 7, mitochondrial [Friedmanniomyces endolithicus]|uniref:Complex III subunit 7 n=1 Tax=Friedmanniomyces endolithicus TaxID=329885 RepID=A0A4V5N8F0_9PEZI|nr:Cytochrome b-c1 complex subunit 7 [Friedmanniomyces endolithicus]KAK0313844.1 Cytochrome b-c1 complex subunit 7 [Friedmanniomyces endolithicus]KAK0831418.1 Cytochrome b-c1 complex subunit 7, mitochondrial [Friedmanniomyces endolithicus]KAK0931300.1 Cytochrome b-c1 complex subunit 7, mitochondrial [Friedmanniomyces endolithicus]KAK1013892.1 Cytochrome b-c1 complex subunit 7, mitochondrial [Friedmanniomyces endolithicus]